MKEIAKAQDMGMQQSLKIYMAALLEEKADDLRHVRIQDMQAARKEDIEEILQSIPDKDVFNAHLQHLIFDSREGLLTAWRCLDSIQQMSHVGRLACFLLASGGRGSILVGYC